MKTAYLAPALRSEMVEVARWAGQNRYSFNEVIVELARQHIEPDADDLALLEAAYRSARWPKARAASRPHTATRPRGYSGTTQRPRRHHG